MHKRVGVVSSIGRFYAAPVCSTTQLITLFHKEIRRVEMYTMQKTLITLMLLVFTAAFAAAPMADNGNSSRATPMKFVGTFYGEGSRVITYHSDGTVSLVNADMFSDDPNLETGGRRSTPFLGVWQKVDDDTIKATTLSFLTEIAGHNYDPDGVIVKTSWLARYDDPVNGVSPGYTTVGDGLVEVFLPDQNPTSDEPILVVTVPPGRGDRLNVD